MIIGISGLAGSGKDTAADFLVQDHGFVRVALADKLKRVCRDVFDFTEEQLWGPSSRRNEEDKRYPRRLNKDGSKLEYLTPRYALQTLGTEWARDCYESIWTYDALRTAKVLLKDSSFHYNPQLGLQNCTAGSLCNIRAKGIVIPDVRFKNEMELIRDAGGHLVRMKRGNGLAGAAALHQSEAEQLELDDSYFTAVIHNGDLSLDELRVEVTKVYKSLC
jgi:hypothetical protein